MADNDLVRLGACEVRLLYPSTLDNGDRISDVVSESIETKEVNYACLLEGLPWPRTKVSYE